MDRKLLTETEQILQQMGCVASTDTITKEQALQLIQTLFPPEQVKVYDRVQNLLVNLAYWSDIPTLHRPYLMSLQGTAKEFLEKHSLGAYVLSDGYLERRQQELENYREWKRKHDATLLKQAS